MLGKKMKIFISIVLYLFFNLGFIFSQQYPLNWENISTNDWGGITTFGLNESYIFAASSNKGVFRYNIATKAWQEIFSDTKLRNINFMKVTDSRIYLLHSNYSSTEQQMIYFSTNYGATWQKKIISISSNNFSPTNITIDNNTLYYASSKGYGSSDEDVSVVSIRNLTDAENSKTYYINDLQIFNNALIYAISYGNGFFLSTINGENWSRVKKDEPSKYYTCLLIDKEYIYLGTEDKGLWRYNTKNGEMLSMAYNLGYMNISSISIVYGRIYISTTGNGVFYFEAKQNKWFEVNSNLPTLKIKKMIEYRKSLYILTNDDKLFKSVVPEPIPIISLSQLDKISFCAYDSYRIIFEVKDYNFKPDNTFRVWLSDSAGTFNFPKLLGTKKGTTTDSINVVFPDSLPLSKFYKLKITASNPVIESNISLENLILSPLPNPIISGELNVCSDRETKYYSSKVNNLTVLWDVTNGTISSKTNDSVTVIWNNGSKGGLKITGTNINFCKNSYSLNVNIRNTPERPIITKINDTLFTSDVEGIQWYFNGTELTGAKQKKLVVAAKGKYKVKIDNFNGCPSDFSEEIYAEKTINSVENLDEKYRVFPNPASDFIEFSLPENVIFSNFDELKILNYFGEEILVKKLSALNKNTNDSSMRLDVSNLSSGIYFIQIKSKLFRFAKI
jgi:hypothetical protein